MIQKIEKRYGMIAIEKDFITVEQLVEAMNVQIMEEIQSRNHRLIGTILVEMGALTQTQSEEVLEALWEWHRSNR